MAANDEAAIGVLMRLREAGVDVPEQVSVAGIDDTRPARFVGLTTITAPLHAMGREAAHAILAGGAQRAGRAAAPARRARRERTTQREALVDVTHRSNRSIIVVRISSSRAAAPRSPG